MIKTIKDHNELQLNKINIAFDVATFSTGYAVIINDKYFTSGTINCKPDRDRLIKTGKYNYGDFAIRAANMINTNITIIFNHINEKYGLFKTQHKPKINVIFEFNDHGSKELGLKLSLFVGIYQAAISASIGLYIPYSFSDKLLTCKHVPAQFWKAKIEKQRQIREFSKENSIQTANMFLEKQGIDYRIDNDDEADAFIMAYYAEKLKDRIIVKQDKATRAKDKHRYQLQLVRTEMKMAKILQAGDIRVKAGKKPFTQATQLQLDKTGKLKLELKAKIKKINDYQLFKGDK